MCEAEHCLQGRLSCCDVTSGWTFRAGALLALFGSDRSASAYTVMAALEAVASVTCEPGSRTTDPILLHSVLSEVAELGRPLFQLFSHPAGM